MYKTLIVLFSIFATVSCMSKTSKETDIDSIIYNKPVYNSEKTDKLVQPFKALAYKADYHVMAYFDGHETYESVEAFIFLKDEGYDFKAIMTKHDQSQTDYISSEHLKIKGKNGTTINRESRSTKGKFNLLNEGKDYTFSFFLEDNREVSIYYKGFQEPREANAGMTDPGGHSPNVGIPMMLRSLSGIGNDECYVKIDGKKYQITEDEEISVKPFFTGYKTYLTKEFFFSLIPSHSSFEELIYNNPNNKKIITEKPLGREEITLGDNNEILSIKHFSSISSDPNSYMIMTFNPSLPNISALKEDQQLNINFAVSYNNSDKEEVHGIISIEKSVDGETTMLLLPQYPQWAKENRNMEYKIVVDGENVSTTGKNINL